MRRGRAAFGTAGPISLVLVPTRELAQQVATAAKPLKNTEYGGIQTLALYGGGREGKDAQLGTNQVIILLLSCFGYVWK
jgi:superfamily II DNA/RNA helicase